MFRASPLPHRQQSLTNTPRQDASIAVPSRSVGFDDSFPIDLIRYSIEAEKRKKHQSHAFQLHYASFHAAPLISLNHRDVVVLDELFVREDMSEIVADVDGMLARFMPAPCWEDCPFEVLEDWL